MNSHDLTPAYYTKRTSVHKALRQWSLLLLLSISLIFLSAAIGSTRIRNEQAGSVKQRMEQVTARLEQARSEARIIETALQQHKRELQASQRLTNRPEWGRVLSLVASQLDERVMMTAINLGRASDAKVRTAMGQLGADVPADSAWLILSGVAESNSDVPALIMRLEKLGLFESVVMTGTQREMFAGGHRTVFNLSCRVH